MYIVVYPGCLHLHLKVKYEKAYDNFLQSVNKYLHATNRANSKRIKREIELTFGNKTKQQKRLYQMLNITSMSYTWQNIWAKNINIIPFNWEEQRTSGRLNVCYLKFCFNKWLRFFAFLTYKERQLLSLASSVRHKHFRKDMLVLVRKKYDHNIRKIFGLIFFCSGDETRLLKVGNGARAYLTQTKQPSMVLPKHQINCQSSRCLFDATAYSIDINRSVWFSRVLFSIGCWKCIRYN